MNDSKQHRSRPFVSRSGQARSVRTWGVILGTVIVAGLAVASFGTFAGAADDTGTGSGTATGAAAPDGTIRPHRQPLTDDQKQCLADHGVTLPQRPADGTRPTPPTDEQRTAFKAAAAACGLPVRGPGGPGFGGPRGDHPQLTDAQKECLADHGVTLPQRPADGTRPTPPTDEQRTAFRAAAAACGLTPPAAPPTI